MTVRTYECASCMPILVGLTLYTLLNTGRWRRRNACLRVVFAYPDSQHRAIVAVTGFCH